SRARHEHRQLALPGRRVREHSGAHRARPRPRALPRRPDHHRSRLPRGAAARVPRRRHRGLVAASSALMTDGAAKNPLARRWWLNLALLAVIAGLGGYAWYRSGKSPDADKPTLTSVAPASVQRIEIERPNEETVRLERRDGRWHLTAPVKARADEFAVEQLMRVLGAPIDATVTPAEGG